jgi:hypothetical protein
VRRAQRQCFERAGWAGLAAAVFKRFAQKRFEALPGEVEAAIESADIAAFDKAFAAFLTGYHDLAAMAWQFLHQDLDVDAALLAEWEETDRAFAEQLRVLSLTPGGDPIRDMMSLQSDEGRDLLLQLAREKTGSAAP